jgi:RNA polymerase sigma factor (sigma-70 family)
MRNSSTQSVRGFDSVRYVAALFEQRHPELQRLCIRWARGHRADADDLCSEACLRALQATSQGGAPFENPLGWLAATVRNLARDRWRAPECSRRADVALETRRASNPDALESLALRELLARAAVELRRLPAKQRRSLLARAAGDDYRSIAMSLETSLENARKLVQTARSTLRERLGLGVVQVRQPESRSSEHRCVAHEWSSDAR